MNDLVGRAQWLHRLRTTTGLRLWGGLGAGVQAILRAVPDRGHRLEHTKEACFVGALRLDDALELLAQRWPDRAEPSTSRGFVDAFDRAPGALVRITKLGGAWQSARTLENPADARKELLRRTPQYRKVLIRSQSILPNDALRVFKTELVGLVAPLSTTDLDQLEERLGSASLQSLFDVGFLWADGQEAFVSRLACSAWPKRGAPAIRLDQAAVCYAESLNRGYYDGRNKLRELEEQVPRLLELQRLNKRRDPGLALRAGIALEPVFTRGQDTLHNLSRFRSWAVEAERLGHLELKLEAEWAATKILLALSRVDEAVTLARKGESAFGRLRDPRPAVSIRVALAHGLLWSDHLEEAHAWLMEAHAIASDALSPYYRGLCVSQLSLTKTRMGDFVGAEAALDMARQYAKDARNLRVQALTRISAGALAASQDLPDVAAIQLFDAGDCLAELGEWGPSGMMMAHSALYELVSGRAERSAEIVQAALHGGRPTDRGYLNLHLVGCRTAERLRQDELRRHHRTALLRAGWQGQAHENDRELLQPVLLPLQIQIASDGSWIRDRTGVTSLQRRHTLRAILRALLDAPERGVENSVLVSAAWSGAKKGNLHTAIWSLRKAGVPIETTAHGYRLPSASYRKGSTGN